MTRWRWEMDERVQATVRNAFGYPRLRQPREPRLTALAIACAVGAMSAAAVLVVLVTR